MPPTDAWLANAFGMDAPDELPKVALTGLTSWTSQYGSRKQRPWRYRCCRECSTLPLERRARPPQCHSQWRRPASDLRLSGGLAYPQSWVVLAATERNDDRHARAWRSQVARSGRWPPDGTAPLTVRRALSFEIIGIRDHSADLGVWGHPQPRCTLPFGDARPAPCWRACRRSGCTCTRGLFADAEPDAWPPAPLSSPGTPSGGPDRRSCPRQSRRVSARQEAVGIGRRRPVFGRYCRSVEPVCL